jgi:predicted MFS family arabinose efflux permease
VLLGINQGLCWSTTVIMKVDLVGPKQRGLATGVNEFAGYIAVAISASATGYLAAAYGLRPVPFYPGVAFALVGLALSAVLVRETKAHALHEAQIAGSSRPPAAAKLPLVRQMRGAPGMRHPGHRQTRPRRSGGDRIRPLQRVRAMRGRLSV